MIACSITSLSIGSVRVRRGETSVVDLVPAYEAAQGRCAFLSWVEQRQFVTAPRPVEGSVRKDKVNVCGLDRPEQDLTNLAHEIPSGLINEDEVDPYAESLIHQLIDVVLLQVGPSFVDEATEVVERTADGHLEIDEVVSPCVGDEDVRELRVASVREISR